jgi:hypothetical protein
VATHTEVSDAMKIVGEPPVTIASYRVDGDAISEHAEMIRRYMTPFRKIAEETGVKAASGEWDIPDLKLEETISLVTVEPHRLWQHRRPTEYRIYMTVFESDRLPSHWVELLNSNANEVWTARNPKPQTLNPNSGT